MEFLAAIAAACFLSNAAPTTRSEQDTPHPSGSGRLVYDDHRRQITLLDTINTTEPTNLRTWSWNGERWELLPGEGPNRRMVGR